jgi:hypothetical protein
MLAVGGSMCRIGRAVDCKVFGVQERSPHGRTSLFCGHVAGSLGRSSNSVGQRGMLADPHGQHRRNGAGCDVSELGSGKRRRGKRDALRSVVALKSRKSIETRELHYLVSQFLALKWGYPRRTNVQTSRLLSLAPYYSPWLLL